MQKNFYDDVKYPNLTVPRICILRHVRRWTKTKVRSVIVHNARRTWTAKTGEISHGNWWAHFPSFLMEWLNEWKEFLRIFRTPEKKVSSWCISRIFQKKNVIYLTLSVRIWSFDNFLWIKVAKGTNNNFSNRINHITCLHSGKSTFMAYYLLYLITELTYCWKKEWECTLI